MPSLNEECADGRIVDQDVVADLDGDEQVFAGVGQVELGGEVISAPGRDSAP